MNDRIVLIFKIGYRERMLHIEWPRTKARIIVTEDNVTKDNTMVHSYSNVSTVKYPHAACR